MVVMKILAWDQLLVVQVQTILVIMVAITVYLKELKILSFFKFIIIMHNMLNTEVIGMVNSLDKDQILNF